MAGYRSEGPNPEADTAATAHEAAPAEGMPADAALGGLPGVVNDLPEVAPHEWIYIMS